MTRSRKESKRQLRSKKWLKTVATRAEKRRKSENERMEVDSQGSSSDSHMSVDSDMHQDVRSAMSGSNDNLKGTNRIFLRARRSVRLAKKTDDNDVGKRRNAGSNDAAEVEKSRDHSKRRIVKSESTTGCKRHKKTKSTIQRNDRRKMKHELGRVGEKSTFEHGSSSSESSSRKAGRSPSKNSLKSKQGF